GSTAASSRRRSSWWTTGPSPTWICGSTHEEPVGELRRVFDTYRPAIPYYNLRQVDARVPPLPDWLREHRR
ncbi:MAG TPA: hypothetical protein VGQ74_10875, partial [Methylomirabilota bacterium]|nr:hypothetical protein [Methylomirabilota bacterium]